MAKRVKKITGLGDAAKELGRIADALERGLAATGQRGKGTKGGPKAGAKAFSWNPAEGLLPVSRHAKIEPSLLVGIEEQQSAFYANAERFINGRHALDALLWGERGTGKTSLVASLFSRFPQEGWAIAHVRAAQVASLQRLLDLLATDERRWFVFFDDLCLAANAEEYHELKIFLDGGISERPQNTLAVVTSNRRHLVAERFPDASSIHPDEDVAEETSLADRFGLSLGFFAMEQETWLDAAAGHLKALGVAEERENWRLEALRWAMERGIRSGRSAAQFARFKAGGG